MSTSNESARQLQHASDGSGSPCRRCGLSYSWKTAYVPCFVEGDTFDTWLARQNEEVRAVARRHEESR